MYIPHIQFLVHPLCDYYNFLCALEWFPQAIGVKQQLVNYTLLLHHYDDHIYDEHLTN